MSQLSTEVQTNISKISENKPEYFMNYMDTLLSTYFMEVDESKLADLASLLVVDELPADPVLHALYYLLQNIKEQDSTLFKSAQECIIDKFVRKISSLNGKLSPYKILVQAFIIDAIFRIPTNSLNILSLKQARAIGLILFQKNELIVDGTEPLEPNGWIALEQILCHGKIATLKYFSSTNDIIPNCEAFEKVLSHLTFLGLKQQLLESFTSSDWQSFGEALSKVKLKAFRLYIRDKLTITNSYRSNPLLQDFSNLFSAMLLRSDQLQALANALSRGQVTQLSLMDNDIGTNTVQKWEEFYRAFSQSTVTNLDLSRNELIGRDEELKWAALLTATLYQSNITHLNLGLNKLKDLSKKSWEIFAKSLSQSKVTHLDLSGNRLNMAIINFLDTPLPLLTGSHVTDLNLADNNLHELCAFEWEQFWITFLSGSNVIRLNLGNLSLDKLPAEQWLIFCDIIRDSKVRVVTVEKPALVNVVHETRSKELSKALINKKGTLANLIRHTLWNVYQMQVEEVDSNPDNNNPSDKSLLIKFEKDGQPYEEKVGSEFLEVLGEASEYTAPLRYT